MVNRKMENRISESLSTYLKYLHKESNVGIRELGRRYPSFSLATIQRHATADINFTTRSITKEGSKPKRGRKKVIDARGERNLVRTLKYNRDKGIPFTSRRLQMESGLLHASNRTVRRTLNKNGFKYLQARRKGLMSRADHKKRVAFARKMIRDHDETFWENDLSFYLDGTSWVFKTNPCDQAATSHAKVWRKENEGLNFGCTSKGKKAGYGGKTIHFFVSISYSKGVISCEQYEKLTGQFFADFVEKNFINIFAKSNNPNGNLFLQDGDPRQNSKVVVKALNNINVTCFPIPPRSPEINPIENLFHLVELKLREDALSRNITKETEHQFASRVRKTLLEFPSDTIDRIIHSMQKRMHMLVKNHGQRLKY